MDLAGAVFVVVCGIGALNSLLLALYLVFHRKGRPLLNALLATLILTFTLRVTKAVVLLFDRGLHPVLELAWIAALGATGIAALAYAIAQAGHAPRWRSLAVRAAAAGTAGTLVALVVLQGFAWRLMGTALAFYGGCAAVALPLLLSRRDPGASDPLGVRWARCLAVFLAFIWLLHATFTVAAHVRPVNEDSFFQVEAVLFSLAVYALVYLELKLGLVARIHPVVTREAIQPDDPMLQRVRRVVEAERLFLDPSLSLPSLAARVNLSPQHVSRLLNAGVGASFYDYVNRLRVEEAQRLLAGPEGAGRKIGALAYECGFRSPSVFYAAFRKFTGRTPSDYVKALSRS